MSKKLLLIISIIAIAGFWASKTFFKKEASKDKSSITEIESNFYWTCPMHPQVHMDHEGECPICHMKLVKVVKESQEQKSTQTEGEKRSAVNATSYQLELIGVQKVEVERMNLKAKIPISGRVLSSSAVAFQVYESDLKNIKAGLTFIGEESVSSEEVSGIITLVDSIVDPSSRTVRVIGSIRKGPRSLLSETSFRGEVHLELDARLAIPESSVLHTGSGKLVYMIGENNRLTPKYVKLGVKTEGFYEVLEGLNQGDAISSGPNFLIDSEAKIRGAND